MLWPHLGGPCCFESWSSCEDSQCDWLVSVSSEKLKGTGLTGARLGVLDTAIGDVSLGTVGTPGNSDMMPA